MSDPVEPKVVVGYIAPMLAEKIRWPKAAAETPAEAPAVTVQLAHPVPGVYEVKLESVSPLAVAEESLKYAESLAKSIVANMSKLSHTDFAGDILALAFAVLHYRSASILP